MKRGIRILLAAVCAVMILSMAVLIASPILLDGVDENWYPGEDGRLFRFLSTARAEEAALEDRSLPMDSSGGMPLLEECVREDGYEDDSIRVKLLTVEEENVVWFVIEVEIGSPTQLRTATAGRVGAQPSRMAAAKNAVVAINGDYYTNDPNKTTFEYRMGEKIRAKTNRKKDVLIIDENGDFHTFIKFPDLKVLDEFYAEGHQIMQAFTFGPVLVKDGELLTMDKDYGYNPNGREPRAAIGQLGKLKYVLVVTENRIDGHSDGKRGATHQELADFMYSLGCTEAFNLDGGNTATLIFNGTYFQDNRSEKNERTQSDIIYFATTAGMEQ